MSKFWGGSTGLWAFWSKIDSIWELGGWPIAWRLVIEDETGIVANVASPLFGSVVVGIIPDHRKHGCVRSPESHHYCWASRIPEVHLGPEPHDLRAAGMRRRALLDELVPR